MFVQNICCSFMLFFCKENSHNSWIILTTLNPQNRMRWGQGDRGGCSTPDQWKRDSVCHMTRSANHWRHSVVIKNMGLNTVLGPHGVCPLYCRDKAMKKALDFRGSLWCTGSVLFTLQALLHIPANTQHLYNGRTSVFDVSPTLHQCYTNVLCLLGSTTTMISGPIGNRTQYLQVTEWLNIASRGFLHIATISRQRQA